jgi:hypothetical protein
MRKWVVRVLVVGGVGFLALQWLPFGRIDHPPTTQDAPWPSPQARNLAVAACYDCHSNETDVQWYDRIAPASWLVKSHVDEGRSILNFSEWDRPQPSHEDDWHDAVEHGDMPLRSYTLLHPAGRLSDAERATLVDAIRQLEDTVDGGGSNRGQGGGGGRDGDNG